MTSFVIRGGRRLEGRLRIGGAKNAVLPILAATLLAGAPCTIHDVPRLRDVSVMLSILRALGVHVEELPGEDTRSLRLDPRHPTTTEIPQDLMRLMRSSLFLMGPLLARFGSARASYPGGCAIGPRPIDLHLKGLAALGANIEERGGFITATAPGGLRGAEIHLDVPSVGATENILMAATAARGRTVIRNAAREPEIVDLAVFMESLGARIRGAGNDLIEVEGQDVTGFGGTEYTVIPDRIEAGTYLVAAAITGGRITVENVIPEHLEAPLAKLREGGSRIETGSDSVTLEGPERPKAVDVKTLPYPGFPTDLQSQMMALACSADGTSILTETIFENRFKVAEEFRRMGAQISIDGRTAVVRGVPRLSGAEVEAMDDLRGGVSLVLAGLAAEGTTIVHGIHHIERGYADLDKKLARLGADIHRVDT